MKALSKWFGVVKLFFICTQNCKVGGGGGRGRAGGRRYRSDQSIDQHAGRTE